MEVHSPLPPECEVRGQGHCLSSDVPTDSRLLSSRSQPVAAGVPMEDIWRDTQSLSRPGSECYCLLLHMAVSYPSCNQSPLQ